MFHCGRLDILPVGDLGVRKGFQALYKLKAGITPCASASASIHPECSAEGHLQLLAASSHLPYQTPLCFVGDPDR